MKKQYITPRAIALATLATQQLMVGSTKKNPSVPVNPGESTDENLAKDAGGSGFWVTKDVDLWGDDEDGQDVVWL